MISVAHGEYAVFCERCNQDLTHNLDLRFGTSPDPEDTFKQAFYITPCRWCIDDILEENRQVVI